MVIIDCAGRHNRTTQRFVHALVDHGLSQVWTLAFHFPIRSNTHDRVVQGITNNREEGGHNRQADLKVLDLQETKNWIEPVADGNKP